METRIISFIPSAQNFQTFQIFGYSSQSIPGLEIVGLGSRARPLKEKFIFLTKQEGLRPPMKRFVLCVEGEFKANGPQEIYRWLELPLLLLYWSMTGFLPIRRLEKCIACGKVEIDGRILSYDLQTSQWAFLQKALKEKGYTEVLPFRSNLNAFQGNALPLDRIFRNMKYIQVMNTLK